MEEPKVKWFGPHWRWRCLLVKDGPERKKDKEEEDEIRILRCSELSKRELLPNQRNGKFVFFLLFGFQVRRVCLCIFSWGSRLFNAKLRKRKIQISTFLLLDLLFAANLPSWCRLGSEKYEYNIISYFLAQKKDLEIERWNRMEWDGFCPLSLVQREREAS